MERTSDNSNIANTGYFELKGHQFQVTTIAGGPRVSLFWSDAWGIVPELCRAGYFTTTFARRSYGHTTVYPTAKFYDEAIRV